MNNFEISERKNTSISRAVGMMTQIYADRAENSEIWDVEGNRYIDFASGSLFRRCRPIDTSCRAL